MSESPTFEFDCAECGMHVIVFGFRWPRSVCVTCMHLPRWFEDPQLCKIFDQDNRRRIPPPEMAP